MTSGDHLSEVRSQLEQACAALVSAAPEDLQRSTAILEQAANRLLSGIPPLAFCSDKSHALSEAWAIRVLTLRARILLEGAAGYHEGWTRQIASLAAGYTPAGQPAAIQHASRLHLQG